VGVVAVVAVAPGVAVAEVVEVAVAVSRIAVGAVGVTAGVTAGKVADV
jgi:hypothetical protein